MGPIGWIIVGGLAGYIAERFMEADHGILTNIFVGILGGIVGGWIFGFFGINLGGFVGSLVTAAVGACIIIWAYRAIRNKEQGRSVDPVMPPSSGGSRDRDDSFTGMH